MTENHFCHIVKVHIFHSAKTVFKVQVTGNIKTDNETLV